MEKISVLMATFNDSECIEKSINSILNQSYKDLELLIIDDGSTDNSYQICMNISQQDNRVKVIKI